MRECGMTDEQRSERAVVPHRAALPRRGGTLGFPVPGPRVT